jgi:hypothetical protein
MDPVVTKPKTATIQRKRCPRCNQRLFVVDGEIEAHAEIPSPRGGRAASDPAGTGTARSHEMTIKQGEK